MESPGEYLKREREHRGVSLAKIQEATRVPMKYLEALEGNDYDNLPHATFTKGFIKNYCRCLGLDEVDAALRFEQFMKERAHGAEATQKEQVKSVSKKNAIPANPRVVAAVAAGVAVLIIFAAYFVLSKKSARVPASAEKIAVKAPAEAQAPTLVQAQAVQPAQGVAPAVPVRQAETAVKVQPKNLTPEKPATASVQAAQKPAERRKADATKIENANRKNSALAPPPTAPVADVTGKTAEAQGADKARVLEITASEPIWVKVGIDNSPPFEVFLRKGQVGAWKAAKGFSLTVGNAGAVSVKLDGVALVPLGPSGKEVSVKLPAGM